MIGFQSGRLTVIGQAASKFYNCTNNYNGYVKESRYWTCRCECGQTKDVAEDKLRRHATKSCGCLPLRPISIGEKFGKLIVIGFGPDRFYGKSKKRNQVLICQCECGNIEERVKRELRHSKSCRSCSLEGDINPNFKHGYASGRRGEQKPESAEYRTWKVIKVRCYNKKFKQYKDYGGRGIRVCERWLCSFENFLADMGLKPSPQHSIDRYPDKDGNYSPENCRWATDKEQRRNRGSNVFLTYNNQTLCVTDWGRKLGVPHKTIRSRLRDGCTVKEALFGRKKLI
jgi:hypothetical protein